MRWGDGDSNHKAEAVRDFKQNEKSVSIHRHEAPSPTSHHPRPYFAHPLAHHNVSKDSWHCYGFRWIEERSPDKRLLCRISFISMSLEWWFTKLLPWCFLESPHPSLDLVHMQLIIDRLTHSLCALLSPLGSTSTDMVITKQKKPLLL